MANDFRDIVFITTISGLTVDDERCCATEENAFSEWTFHSAPDVPMWKVLSPIIIVLGTFGNVMTIVIMRRMSEGQSSHTMSLYFTALAVSDLLLLYAGLFRKFLYFYFDIVLEKLHVILSKLLPFLIYSSSIISAWLIVAMTMQRVMSVVWPHHTSLLCTKRKVELVIATIVLVPFALNAHRLVITELANGANFTNDLYAYTNEEVNNYSMLIYPWIDLALSSILPFCILIIGNTVLVRKVIQSVHVARVMTAGGCDQVNSRQKKASSLTLTLITVSMVFLLLSMPLSIYLIVFPYVIDYNSITSMFTASFIYAVFQLMWYTNSAISFYLYCLTGSRFRNELKSLFCKQPPALKPSTVISLPNDTTRLSKIHSDKNIVDRDF